MYYALIRFSVNFRFLQGMAKVAPGVNFTYPVVQIANAPAHKNWCVKKCDSPSPIKLCRTLLVHRTRNYIQLLHFTSIAQKDLRKSSGTKAAH